MTRRAVAIAGLIGALLAGGCQTVSRTAFTFDQFGQLRGLSLSVAMAPVGSDNNLRFDRFWMQGLFDKGRATGLNGVAWSTPAHLPD